MREIIVRLSGILSKKMIKKRCKKVKKTHRIFLREIAGPQQQHEAREYPVSNVSPGSHVQGHPELKRVVVPQQVSLP